MYPATITELPEVAAATDLADGFTLREKLEAQLGPYRPVVMALQDRVGTDGDTDPNSIEYRLSHPAPMLLQSTAVGMVPLTIKAASGQTGDLVRVTDSDDVVRLRMTSARHLRWQAPNRPPLAIGTFTKSWVSAYPGWEAYDSTIGLYGINVGATGTPVDTTKPSIWLQFEEVFVHAFPSGDEAPGAEIHFNFQYTGIAGTPRPWGASFNLETGEISQAVRGSVAWESSDGVLRMQLHHPNNLLNVVDGLTLAVGDPADTEQATIDIGGRGGTYPAVMIVGGLDQVQPLLDVRLWNNSTVFRINADGSIFSGGGALNQVGDWEWQAAGGAPTLAYFGTGIKQIELTEDTALLVTPTATTRARLSLGRTGYPSLFVWEGADQVVDIMDVRTADNISKLRVLADTGEVRVGSGGLVVNHGPGNDGAAITAQPAANAHAVLFGRRRNGQTGHLVRLCEWDLSKTLFAIDKDGYPLIRSDDGLTHYRLSVDQATGQLRTTLVVP